AACAADRAGGAASRPERPDVLLATTTSFQDSGLLDVLVADFERATGYRIRATAVGSGAAIALGARGDADVVFAHSREAEERFMAAGHGERRLLVMHNDFVIVGPAADPAGIKGDRALEAVRAIAAARATFVSRGDESGTHVFERGLWQQAGIAPSGDWYLEAATGMGQTLQIASEKSAYALTDRGTYLARRATVALAVLVERDPPLVNPYHVMTVSAARFPRVNAAGANAFADYLVSPQTQGLIAAFGVDRYGEPLFVADAGKQLEELR
ncbi:MAG: substrate-binding domain-containing protein, partial [Candidatus Limnocylindria bacterium]